MSHRWKETFDTIPTRIKKEQFSQSRWTSSQAVPAKNFDWLCSDDEQRLQEKEKTVRPMALHACF